MVLKMIQREIDCAEVESESSTFDIAFGSNESTGRRPTFIPSCSSTELSDDRRVPGVRFAVEDAIPNAERKEREEYCGA